VNLDGLSDLLMAPSDVPEPNSDNVERTGKIERILGDVFKQVNLFTRRLLAVRTHHELTRIELEDYEEYLHRILH